MNPRYKTKIMKEYVPHSMWWINKGKHRLTGKFRPTYAEHRRITAVRDYLMFSFNGFVDIPTAHRRAHGMNIVSEFIKFIFTVVMFVIRQVQNNQVWLWRSCNSSEWVSSCSFVLWRRRFHSGLERENSFHDYTHMNSTRLNWNWNQCKKNNQMYCNNNILNSNMWVHHKHLNKNF